MSGTLRAWARRLWPRHPFPELRGRVAASYRTPRAVKENLRFQVWRWISHRRRGEMRPVTVYGIQEILVRTDDFRSYLVAWLQGSQKDKIALWSQAAQWKPGVCIDVGANYGEFSAAVTLWWFFAK